MSQTPRGGQKQALPSLKVHGTDKKEVSSDVYLGDIIMANGKNDMNVKNRICRGLGKITEIMEILEKLPLGEHYFSTAVLLRESLFRSTVLSSADVWYGLSKDHIEENNEFPLFHC